jgi:hypothetical protein
MSDSLMDIKREMADQAREFYKRPITPYHFVIGKIEKSDFSLKQLFSDDSSGSILDFNYNEFFVFAYEINPEALN